MPTEDNASDRIIPTDRTDFSGREIDVPGLRELATATMTSKICPNTPHFAFLGGLALVGLVSPMAELGL